MWKPRFKSTGLKTKVQTTTNQHQSESLKEFAQGLEPFAIHVLWHILNDISTQSHCQVKRLVVARALGGVRKISILLILAGHISSLIATAFWQTWKQQKADTKQLTTTTTATNNMNLWIGGTEEKRSNKPTGKAAVKEDCIVFGKFTFGIEQLLLHWCMPPRSCPCPPFSHDLPTQRP